MWTDKHTHVDRQTYARTDGHLRPALLGRLCQKVNLKIQVGQFIGHCWRLQWPVHKRLGSIIIHII